MSSIAQDLLYNLHEVNSTNDSWKKVEDWKNKYSKRGANKFFGTIHDKRQEFWAVRRESGKPDVLISALDLETQKEVYNLDDSEKNDARALQAKKSKSS